MLSFCQKQIINKVFNTFTDNFFSGFRFKQELLHKFVR